MDNTPSEVPIATDCTVRQFLNRKRKLNTLTDRNVENDSTEIKASRSAIKKRKKLQRLKDKLKCKGDNLTCDDVDNVTCDDVDKVTCDDVDDVTCYDEDDVTCDDVDDVTFDDVDDVDNLENTANNVKVSEPCIIDTGKSDISVTEISRDVNQIDMSQTSSKSRKNKKKREKMRARKEMNKSVRSQNDGDQQLITQNGASLPNKLNNSYKNNKITDNQVLNHANKSNKMDDKCENNGNKFGINFESSYDQIGADKLQEIIELIKISKCEVKITIDIKPGIEATNKTVDINQEKEVINKTTNLAPRTKLVNDSIKARMDAILKNNTSGLTEVWKNDFISLSNDKESVDNNSVSVSMPDHHVKTTKDQHHKKNKPFSSHVPNKTQTSQCYNKKDAIRQSHEKRARNGFINLLGSDNYSKTNKQIDHSNKKQITRSFHNSNRPRKKVTVCPSIDMLSGAISCFKGATLSDVSGYT